MADARESNGHLNADPSWRLRWIWLGGSIIADRDNPLVKTNRAVIRALQEQGQQVEYLEPANHPGFVESLRLHGSGFYRNFLAEYPDIRYRRYDLPRPGEHDVWYGREAALVDVLVVESAAPPGVFEWLARVDGLRALRVLVTNSPERSTADFDLIFAPSGGDLPYVTNDSGPDAPELAERMIAAVASARGRLKLQG